MSLAVPALLGTVRTGIREGLASWTCWDVPSSPNLSWDCWDWDSRGLGSGTSWDVPSCPSLSWDCQDCDSRGSSLWDLMGCPKLS